ncbi:nucleotidyltransferase family protein [Aidingimonas lacisalsi]|uniref:nucleotidyltransferase family protein n=1 Tax=Aidingimonas lacisalsi TaxID=2604086 RepID=UPI0011D2310D|nr:nucleotidyltransferase domain-containing protein [Aidingimonas lacisalsi]
MRISQKQAATIQSICQTWLGDDLDLRVYGSRLDDSRRGGDIDLLVITPYPVSRLRRAQLTMALEDALGIAVDVLCYQAGTTPSPFASIALNQALPLRNVA